MKFSNYFKINHFKKILEHEVIDKIDNDWREKYRAIKHENFDKPLIAFLEAKRSADGLLKIQYSEGHVTRMSEAWNSFVENKKTIKEENITEGFYKIISDFCFNYEKEPINEEFILNRYNKLVDFMTKGNIRYSQMAEDLCECNSCGQKFKMSIKDWLPIFNIFEKDLNGQLNYLNLIPPESCFIDKIEEVKVNFPTGELIVSDWIRIDEFTKAVSYEEDDKWSNEKSLNFSIGCSFMIKHYAEKHNFVHVMIGNSSPSVFHDGNNLVVGRINLDDEIELTSGFKEKAKICTDLWGVTIIDKETLIEVVALKAGEKANEIVENYLKEDNSHNVIPVNPGSHTLKFNANYWNFNKKIDDDNLPSEIKKLFCIYSNELKAKNKIKL